MGLFNTKHKHNVNHNVNTSSRVTHSFAGTVPHSIDPEFLKSAAKFFEQIIPGLNVVGENVGLRAGEEAATRTFQYGLLGSIMLMVGAWRGFSEYEANGIISHAIRTGLLSGLVLLAALYVLAAITVHIHNLPAPPKKFMRHVTVLHNILGVHAYADEQLLYKIFGEPGTPRAPKYDRKITDWAAVRASEMYHDKCYEDLSKCGFVHLRDTHGYFLTIKRGEKWWNCAQTISIFGREDELEGEVDEDAPSPEKKAKKKKSSAAI